MNKKISFILVIMSFLALVLFVSCGKSRTTNNNEETTSSQIYDITFVNYDNSILSVQQYHKGENIYYDGDKPTKPSTDAYDYIYIGWNRPLQKCVRSETYIAQFKEQKRKYTIKFKDENGNVISSNEYEYGTDKNDILVPNTPSKAEDQQNKYQFTGWSPEIDDVTKIKNMFQHLQV